jgi:hypothetical protein
VFTDWLSIEPLKNKRRLNPLWQVVSLKAGESLFIPGRPVQNHPHRALPSPPAAAATITTSA